MKRTSLVPAPALVWLFASMVLALVLISVMPCSSR
jgi:hypothetical protein